MAKITYTGETTASPEAVVAAARDFSERRLKLWPSIDPKYYEVHELDDGHALVTEGTDAMGGIWARERYEWPEPGVVRATVQESNVFRSGTWELRARPREDGGSYVEVRNHRRARGAKGHLIGAMVQLTGRRMLGASLARTLANIETMNGRG